METPKGSSKSGWPKLAIFSTAPRLDARDTVGSAHAISTVWHRPLVIAVAAISTIFANAGVPRSTL